MDRPIEFRAWDKAKKVMYQKACVGFHGMVHWTIESKSGITGQCSKDVIPMQYIGLRDKNRTKIYEGDIVLFDDTDIGGGKTKGEVIWNDDLLLHGLGWHLWVIETNIKGSHSGFMGMNWLGMCEVLGNVYENPELLEVEGTI